MKYSFENKNPLWHVHEGLVPRPGQKVIDGQIVNVYPDNDGGLWFWHPVTGERKVLNE